VRRTQRPPRGRWIASRDAHDIPGDTRLAQRARNRRDGRVCCSAQLLRSPLPYAGGDRRYAPCHHIDSHRPDRPLVPRGSTTPPSRGVPSSGAFPARNGSCASSSPALHSYRPSLTVCSQRSDGRRITPPCDKPLGADLRHLFSVRAPDASIAAPAIGTTWITQFIGVVVRPRNDGRRVYEFENSRSQCRGGLDAAGDQDVLGRARRDPADPRPGDKPRARGVAAPGTLC
jgi:hypothetical protein